MADIQPPPGASVTYRQRFNRCGKRDCPRCAPGVPGHGPYWYAYWREGGHVRSSYLGKRGPPPGPAALAGKPGPAPRADTYPSAISASPPGRPGHLHLRVRTLGAFAIWRGTEPIPAARWHRRKAATLCKLLLAAPGHRLHREQAAAQLWLDEDPVHVAANLHATVYQLRKILDPPGAGASHVRAEGEFLTLAPALSGEPDPDWWDAATFAQAALAALAGQDAGACRAALARYSGEYLPDDLYEEWATARREAIRRQRLSLLLHLSGLSVKQQHPEEAVQCLHAILDADPCHEEAACALMHLHATSGRRTEAIRVFRRLAAALERDLGVEPQATTRALYRAMLDGALAEQLPPVSERLTLEQPRVEALLLEPPRAPLVGRLDELGRLQRHLEPIRHGNGGLVLLYGAPGVGKSRLLAEFLAGAHAAGALVLFGRAYLPEGRLPYGPLLEALRGYAQAQQPAVLARHSADHRAVLAGLLPEFARAASPDLPSSPAPAASAGNAVQRDAMADRYRLFAALGGLLREVSRAAPVVLALEDLHWADAATLQALHFLQRTCRDVALLLVGTYRAEEAMPGTPLAELAGALRRGQPDAMLEVGPLNEAATGTLLANLLAPEPVADALVSWVATRSRGNPLFIEELVTGLREEDRIQLRQEGWQITGSGALGVPAGIQALINERVARLDPDTRRLLWLCAVANREVDFGLLHELTGLDEEPLLAALDAAVAAGLLEETAPGAPAGYTFHHPLFVEAIYNALSSQRRVVLHRRVAGALERHCAEQTPEHAPELAWHFGQGGNHAQAARYGLVAGEQAAAAYANAEALAYFIAARRQLAAAQLPSGGGEGPDAVLAGLDERIGDLRLLIGEFAEAQEDFTRARLLEPDPARRAALWRKEGSSWVKRGSYERALAAFDTAEQEHGALPPGVRADVQLSRGDVLYRQGDFTAAEQAVQRALALTGGGSQDAVRAAHAYNLLGNVAFRRGEYQRAEEHHRASLSARERAGDQGGMAASWHNLGNLAQDRGDLPGAESCFQRSLAILERMGDQARIAISLNSLGSVALQHGALAQAEDWYRRGLAICEQIEDRAGLANGWRCLGDVAHVRGDLLQAQACYERSLALWEQTGDPVGIASCWTDLGDLACDRGDFATAARFARQARRLGRRIGVPRREALAALEQSRAHLLAGHPRLAAAFLHHGRALATAQGLVKGMVFAARLSAELHLQHGAIAEARWNAEQALQLAIGAQSAHDEGQARRLLGRCLLAGGALDQALDHLRASLRIFEGVGAELELARSRLALAEALTAREMATGDGSGLTEARALLMAARGCFAERVATWDMAQADRRRTEGVRA